MDDSNKLCKLARHRSLASVKGIKEDIVDGVNLANRNASGSVGHSAVGGQLVRFINNCAVALLFDWPAEEV